jgi:hypothetical protein
MSVPTNRGKALKGLKKQPNGRKKLRDFERIHAKSRHLKTTDSLRQSAGSYSEHPQV